MNNNFTGHIPKIIRNASSPGIKPKDILPRRVEKNKLHRYSKVNILRRRVEKNKLHRYSKVILPRRVEKNKLHRYSKVLFCRVEWRRTNLVDTQR